MRKVVLLYDADCPNVRVCRANLMKAFAAVGEKPRWQEVDRMAEDTPKEFKAFGSPTLLVDGRDVAGGEPGLGGASCRLYRSEKGGYEGAPPVERIAEFLGDSRQRPARGKVAGKGWRDALAALGAIGSAVAPNMTCPLCWPAYAAVLSSFGIGFMPSSRVLLPLTLVFLAIYVGLLAWDARKRRRVGPLALGTVASVLLASGRFALSSSAALYAGVILLVTASIWNVWPAMVGKRSASSGPAKGCPACQSGGPSEKAAEDQPKEPLTPDLATDRRM